MSEETRPCGHCGATIFCKTHYGVTRKYCSEKCRTRASRNRRKGVCEMSPVRSRPERGTIFRRDFKSGTVYTVRFKVRGNSYFYYHGRDKNRAQRIRSEISAKLKDGSWTPPPPKVKKLGRVLTESRNYGTHFRLRFVMWPKTYDVSLGRSTDGWTYELAEAERARIAEEIRAGVWTPPPSRRDPKRYAGETCEKIERDIVRAIETYERSTHREALPQLQALKEVAARLRADLAA